MPLDATNFSETIPAPLTLEDLIAWLRTKPAQEEYDWIKPDRCVIGQYVKDRGGLFIPTPTDDERGTYRLGKTSWDVSATFFAEIAWNCDGPFTFGAALARALTYAATGKV